MRRFIYGSFITEMSRNLFGTVKIEMNNKVYTYYKVPKEIFINVAEAKSVGRAYNQLIKGKY